MYRPDIDGLRGFAVLCVLVFHGYVGILPGGFIGVDIFFVISGYLITLILFKCLREKTFTIQGFYARRVKRIFPALITVLVAVGIAGWLVQFPNEFADLGRHIGASAVFASNILLWRETGYFNESAESKPLLHLWSLGIEEQFYLIYPLILWWAYRSGMRLVRLLLILLAISFALSVLGTFSRPVATFYLPITRLWELLVGCTLAVWEVENKNSEAGPNGDRHVESAVSHGGHKYLKELACCLGIVLIGGGAVAIDKHDAFPGLWALFPTLGTALVIMSGPESSVNRRIVGNKFLVGIGLISYPLYLWHWPLLYFGRILFPIGMSSLGIALILLASFVLALLTFFIIEKPIRFGGVMGGWKVFILTGGMCVLLGFGFFVSCRIVPSRLGLNSRVSEAAKASDEWVYPFEDNYRRLSGFKKDVEIVSGKPGNAVLFIGDSHMQHYWPRIEVALAELGNGARPVIFITAGGSPALPGVNRVLPGFQCDKFFEFALERAKEPNVTSVVISCAWERYFIGVYPDEPPADIYRTGEQKRVALRIAQPAAREVFSAFGQEVAKLTKIGKEVIVILPGPTNSKWSPAGLSRLNFRGDSGEPVFVTRMAYELYIAPVKRILIDEVVSNGGRTIDPLDCFEEENGRLNGMTPDGRFRYKDASHFRAFYVREKALFIDDLVRSRDN
jgi:peptidoglycan/LPS O-acetylase OafA/YrhL